MATSTHHGCDAIDHGCEHIHAKVDQSKRGVVLSLTPSFLGSPATRFAAIARDHRTAIGHHQTGVAGISERCSTGQWQQQNPTAEDDRGTNLQTSVDASIDSIIPQPLHTHFKTSSESDLPLISSPLLSSPHQTNSTAGLIEPQTWPYHHWPAQKKHTGFQSRSLPLTRQCALRPMRNVPLATNTGVIEIRRCP